jgi:hypothetical protein
LKVGSNTAVTDYKKSNCYSGTDNNNYWTFGGNGVSGSNGNNVSFNGNGYSLRDIIIICVGVVVLMIGVVLALLVYFRNKVKQVEEKLNRHVEG